METYISGYRNGEPVYGETLTVDEKIARLERDGSPEWKSFTEKFDTDNEGNLSLLKALFVDRLDDDSTAEQDRHLLKAVTQAGGIITVRTIKHENGTVLFPGGQYEFELRPQVRTVEEPEVPRDRNGNPLTASQLAWSEYRQFSETHSMEEIRARARTDAGFSSFMRKQYEREARETPSTQFAIAGQTSAENKPAITPELIAWVEEFRKTPMDRVRALRSPSLNPLGFQVYNANLETALAACLIGR